MKTFVRFGLMSILFFFIISPIVSAEEQRVYDQANLLTTEEIQALENQAAHFFTEWDTDFIIITTQDTEGQTTKRYTQDFTDGLAETFNRVEDNMAVITVNMEIREVYVAGFGRAEEYIDNSRVERILDHVYPLLAQDNYYQAFELFFEKADDYLGVRPGVNPDSIFFNTFFQLAISLGLAGVIVFFMAYTSGGKVTVTSGTYLDQTNSQIISKRDRYLRKTVTRRKKPSSNNNRGGGGFGGGGGGITGAGRSHSGGSRRF